MANKKRLSFDPGEYEKLTKQLEQFRQNPEKPADDPGYFNPWNLSKKKIPGKHTICTSLPEDLP